MVSIDQGLTASDFPEQFLLDHLYGLDNCQKKEGDDRYLHKDFFDNAEVKKELE